MAETVFLPITLSVRAISIRGSLEALVYNASVEIPIPGAMAPPIYCLFSLI